MVSSLSNSPGSLFQAFLSATPGSIFGRMNEKLLKQTKSIGFLFLRNGALGFWAGNSRGFLQVLSVLVAPSTRCYIFCYLEAGSHRRAARQTPCHVHRGSGAWPLALPHQVRLQACDCPPGDPYCCSRPTPVRSLRLALRGSYWSASPEKPNPFFPRDLGKGLESLWWCSLPATQWLFQRDSNTCCHLDPHLWQCLVSGRRAQLYFLVF